MNYELALRLKEAGFPQGLYDFTRDGEHYQFRETDDVPENNRTMWARYYTQEFLDKHIEELVLIPTLSELIEECGERFRWLVHEHSITTLNEWYASDGTNTWKEDAHWGITPEEAVANLYLALNKKK